MLVITVPIEYKYSYILNIQTSPILVDKYLEPRVRGFQLSKRNFKLIRKKVHDQIEGK